MRALLIAAVVFWCSAAAQAQTVVVAFGDSLTHALYTYLPYLGPQYKIVNEGYGCQDCLHMVERVDEYIATGAQMDIGIIMCGANDGRENEPEDSDPVVECSVNHDPRHPQAMTLTESIEAVEDIVDAMTAYGATPVVVAEIPALSGGDTWRINRLASMAPLLESYASSCGIHFVNAWQHFTDYSATYTEDALYLDALGYVHPNHAGRFELGRLIQATLDTFAPPLRFGARE